jgi:hypothetical protein
MACQVGHSMAITSFSVLLREQDRPGGLDRYHGANRAQSGSLWLAPIRPPAALEQIPANAAMFVVMLALGWVWRYWDPLEFAPGNRANDGIED